MTLLHTTIQRFANQMQIELENNADKGDFFEWEGLESKLVDLEYHKGKLLIAIKEKNLFAIKEYIADCGNILASIGNEFGVYNKPNENSNFEAVMNDNSISVAVIGQTKRRKLI